MIDWALFTPNKSLPNRVCLPFTRLSKACSKLKAVRKTGAEERPPAAAVPHVLILPCPAQGHVNVMLKLAELLALSNFHITFLNSDHIHRRLTRFSDVESRFSSCYSGLVQFKAISDGFPLDHPRESLGELLQSFNVSARPLLRNMLHSDELCSQSLGKPRVNCIIGDGIFGNLTSDIGDELGIPVIHFRTISACCFWAYFCIPRLFETGELPIRGNEDMDRIITNIPGMENFIRCRDLPSFCRFGQTAVAGDTNHVPLDSVSFETHQSLRARALILNTFNDLESHVLSQIRTRFPKVFTIGPLHTHLKSRAPPKTLPSESPLSSSNNLFEEDRTCMAWLDTQPPKSVLYVSFGSFTTVKKRELMEICHGLVNSKKRFLWVIRPDMVAGKDGEDETLAKLAEETKERGFMVGWAPQEEVLAHPAIGGFMTHSGWNSTLESIVAGVPMICWPFFADQQVNSRFVSEAWGLGLDMKDTCEREIVEKMVNDLMKDRREEFVKAAENMAALAKKSISEGGSCYSNFEHLIEFVKSISVVH